MSKGLDYIPKLNIKSRNDKLAKRILSVLVKAKKLKTTSVKKKEEELFNALMAEKSNSIRKGIFFKRWKNFVTKHFEEL